MKIEIDFINKKISVEDNDLLSNTAESIIKNIADKYFPEYVVDKKDE